MINVFNIEKFATHDGPGIRTTIFLKGCSLHCPWCANPESWSIQPTFMYDQRKCVGCLKCVQVCTKKALSFHDGVFYRKEKCMKCRKCEMVCLNDAISFAGREISIEDIIKEVLKDRDYFNNSQGGVTISGGEPFFQYEKLIKLLKKLKEENLHIALETTGNYSLDKLKGALPYIDLFLFDIKHLNKDKLEEVVGGDYFKIINNFEYLAKNYPTKLVMRVPVIPSFNQDIIFEIIDYALENQVLEVDLLPYHTLGKNKWNQMFKEYQIKEKMIEKKELYPYVQYGKEKNILVKIGG